jgi:hypothetical protein
MLERLILPMATLIVAGYASISPLQAWRGVPGYNSNQIIVLCLVTLGVLAPFFPLLAAIILRFTQWRMKTWKAMLLASLTVIIGAMMTLVTAAFSDQGFLITLMKGSTLTMAVAASFILIARSGLHSGPGFCGVALMAAPMILAVWSIYAGVLVALLAAKISDGKPYCLAVHGSGKAVQSWAGLRGLSFYTSGYGYKRASSEYFHGVLMVLRGDPGSKYARDDRGMRLIDGSAVYNWSPRGLRFERTDYPVMTEKACTPTPNFLSRLSWVEFGRY